MAWIEAKRIKGKTYLYLRWRDGRSRSKYIGKAGDGWQAGMTKEVPNWRVGQPLPSGALEPPPPRKPPALSNTAEPEEPESNNGRWPACVCCGRPAQTLYDGEPACYKCAHHMKNNYGYCP